MQGSYRSGPLLSGTVTLALNCIVDEFGPFRTGPDRGQQSVVGVECRSTCIHWANSFWVFHRHDIGILTVCETRPRQQQVAWLACFVTWRGWRVFIDMDQFFGQGPDH